MGRWLNRLVIFLCVLVVSACAAIVMPRFGVLPGPAAALTTFSLCIAVILYVRQRRLSHELARAQAQGNAMAPDAGKDDEREKLRAPAREPVAPPSAPDPDPKAHLDTTPTTAISERPAPVPASPSASAATPQQPVKPASDLVMHLQPVVSLSSRRPVLYDVQYRFRTPEGHLIDPDKYIRAANDNALVAAMDRRAVAKTVRLLGALQSAQANAQIICPVSIASIGDIDALGRLMEVLRRDKHSVDALFIAMDQRAFQSMDRPMHARLKALGELCGGLILGRIQDFRIDIATLSALGFTHVRVQSTLYLHASAQTDPGVVEPADLARDLADHGLQLIVCDVERDRDVVKIAERGARLAQGELFAPPRPVRPELLTPAGG